MKSFSQTKSDLIVLEGCAVGGLRSSGDTLYNEVKNRKEIAMTQIRASHILVEDQEQAEDLKKQIDEGASFDTIARQHSLCPSKRNGGDLGWFGKGQMVKPFEEAAFRLTPGQVSNPVKTQFGFHLIKVTEQK